MRKVSMGKTFAKHKRVSYIKCLSMAALITVSTLTWPCACLADGNVMTRDATAEEAVLAAMHQMHHAFDHQDIPAIADCIADDDFLFVYELNPEGNAVKLNTKAELIKFLKTTFDSFRADKTTTEAKDPVMVARATSTFAIVTEECSLKVRLPGNKVQLQSLRATAVARKGTDGWKFTHWHMSSSAPRVLIGEQESVESTKCDSKVGTDKETIRAGYELPKESDRQFAKSYHAAGRADLFAYRNLDAKITKGDNLTVDSLSKELNGTWVRRLTMHGIPVQTDSFYYFDMDGPKGTAMLIDRTNMGEDKEKPDLSESPTMTFVNGKHFIVDRYIKVSSEKPKVHAMELGEIPLKEAFRRLVDADYFQKAPTVDPQRLKRIEDGDEPGGELFLPSITGGIWEVSLTTKKDEHLTQGHDGVSMTLRGDLRSKEFPKGLVSEEETTVFREGGRLITNRGWTVKLGHSKDQLNEVWKWDRVVIVVP